MLLYSKPPPRHGLPFLRSSPNLGVSSLSNGATPSTPGTGIFLGMSYLKTGAASPWEGGEEFTVKILKKRSGHHSNELQKHCKTLGSRF